jgi:octaprenyl-diphosphate synthase
MSVSLKQIQKPFKEEMVTYNSHFKKVMSSDIKLVDTIVKYIVKHKGKNLRPLLVVMSGKLCGPLTENTYITASIVEMLHSATLIHDDVVDEAELRRGFPSINAVWKNKIAVLIGDYLLSKCLIGGTGTGSLEVMKVLADSAKRLSKGELKQIEKSKTLNITEEEFFKMISNKTGALIGAACELGAITTSNSIEDRQNLRSFGESIGMAFQIRDDLLDYYGSQKLVGKPIGNDFKDKKITLPLIFSFQHAPKKESSAIKKIIKKGVKKTEIKEIIRFAEKYNGIKYAQTKLKEYAEKAKKALVNYPDNDVKASMLNFVDYIILRSM